MTNAFDDISKIIDEKIPMNWAYTLIAVNVACDDDNAYLMSNVSDSDARIMIRQALTFERMTLH